MLDAGMLDPQIAYLTGDAAVTSPFVQSFRVREVLSAHPKAINQALRAYQTWDDWRSRSAEWTSILPFSVAS